MRLSNKSIATAGAALLALGLTPGVSHAAPAAAAATTVAGEFFSLAPARLLDTRTGNGAAKQPLGADSTLHLQVTGRGGVPSSGVSAVVLNVTVTDPSSTSFITVYPTGISRPTASNLNITKGWTGANSVTVPVGTGGQVDIWNQAGSTSVIADVTGYYAADSTGAVGTGGQFFPSVPWRAGDTRELGGPIGAGGYFDVGFDYGTANSHIKAVALNITAVDPTSSGFLTAWSGVGAVPNASTLNFAAGTIVPNMAVIPTRACDDPSWCYNAPVMRIQNTGGQSVDIVVDVLGFYDDGQLGDGLNFVPVTPTRITDTRIGQGLSPLTFNNTQTETVPAAFQGSTIYSLSANATGISPTAQTFVSFWPNDPAVSKPDVSTLNLMPGDIKPNATVLTLYNSQFNAYNLSGVTNLAIDVSGTFNYLGTAAAASTLSTKALATTAGPRTLPTPSQHLARVGG